MDGQTCLHVDVPVAQGRSMTPLSDQSSDDGMLFSSLSRSTRSLTL